MNLSTLNKSKSHSAKAIIFSSDGYFLMQLRDNKKSIRFPNCWNFFGGAVENKEKPQNTIARELKEELGIELNKKPRFVFKSSYFDGDNIMINHFYLFHVEKKFYKFELNEGKEAKWFSLEKLTCLNLTPPIYENIFKIFKNISQISNKKINKFEIAFLKLNNLKKKNNRTYFSSNNNFCINRQNIIIFREILKLNKINIGRICFHKNLNDQIQEMLIFHNKKIKIKSHKQNKSSVSYHIYEGSINIVTYDKNNKIIKSNKLIKEKNNSHNLEFYRLRPNIYRSIKSLSDYAIFFEIACGPFKDKDTIWMK